MAGKDRTGVIVALILQLVGVEDHVIAEEYALTEVGLAAWKDIIINHLMKDMDDVGREGAERMVGARRVNSSILMTSEVGLTEGIGR